MPEKVEMIRGKCFVSLVIKAVPDSGFPWGRQPWGGALTYYLP